MAWLIWNWAIFGNPLNFQDGAYAKPSNWVTTGERTAHNLWISLRTYQIATVDNITAVVAVLGVIGLVVYLWRTRLSRDSLPVLALLIMFPMFVVTLYKGERPLHVSAAIRERHCALSTLADVEPFATPAAFE